MNREDMLTKIETLYKGRESGDRAQFASVLAPDATFRFVGDGSVIMSFPGGRTDEPDKVARELFEQIEMLDRRLVSATIEENRAAVHWRVVLKVKGGAPFEQELFDLWEFNETGLITKGSQFQDTAKILNEMDDAEMAKSAQSGPRGPDDDGGGPGPSIDFGLGSR
ncbi:MAG: nuclear transport factor 2 family protein [Pseudomonadota bacterium]